MSLVFILAALLVSATCSCLVFGHYLVNINHELKLIREMLEERR